MFSRSTLLVLVLAFAAGLGFWLGQRHLGSDGGAIDVREALLYPQPRALPDFELTRADGTPFTQADWRGRWNLVFIGFTHCPDICPTTLATLREVEAAFEPDQAPQVIFVSVDPERDQPQQLATYARFFSERFVAATGAHDALTPFTRSLGMVYMSTPLDGGDYTVDHSASIAIIDPQGRLFGVFRAPHSRDGMVADLKRLMRG
ncbi:MAG TPA: SCO family protein [Xanthomonadaceae bacterium]|nr:SCO family protein [Xanthomonadaceae bacterium]